MRVRKRGKAKLTKHERNDQTFEFQTFYETREAYQHHSQPRRLLEDTCEVHRLKKFKPSDLETRFN